jgi:hypothetical protein
MQAARSQSWRERTAVVGDEDPLDGPVAASEAHERLQRASRHVGRGEERSCLQSRCRWKGDSPQELGESDATPTYQRSLPRSRARRRFRHTPAAELARAASEGDVVAATAARCAAAALQRERWKESEHEGDAVRRAGKHVR